MVHFRFLSIPVYIDKSYWFFLLMIIGMGGSPSYRTSILLAFIFTFSVFIHECGHALVALFFGTEPMIRLQAFGGRTEFNASAATDKQKLLITLAGPLFQGLLTLMAYVLSHLTEGYLGYLFFLTTYINVTWLLLNLLPILPLDGGQLVRYMLEKKFGRKGYRASIIIGLVATAVAIPYLYFHKYYFFAIHLFLSGLYYCKLWQKDF